MNASARTRGLDQLRAKLLSRFPAAAKAKIKEANQQNAEEFARRVKAILPRGDDRGGHIEDTVRVEARGDTGFATAIGDAAHPYPAHLEFGHMAGNTHVPGKPAWFPALRLFRRRAKSRQTRALRLAVQILQTGLG